MANLPGCATHALAVVLLLLPAATARADQFHSTGSDIATKAKALLTKADSIVSLCSPCGETTPSRPEAIRSVELRQLATGRWNILVNGSARDLAYTYVHRGNDRYENIALLAGAFPSGVMTSVSVEQPTAKSADPSGRSWLLWLGMGGLALWALRRRKRLRV